MKTKHISNSVLLPYQRDQVYELVADIDSYQEFLPWCESSRIIDSNSTSVVGEVRVGMSGVQELLVTRNTMEPHQRIGLELLQGPFSQFQGEWLFAELGSGCKVTLDLTYQFKSIVLHLLISRLSEMIVNRILHAFSDRASDQLTPCM